MDLEKLSSKARRGGAAMLKDDVVEEIKSGKWLRGAAAETFRNKLDVVERRVRRVEGAVLVAEADPLEFLAVFFAALSSGRAVALGNFGWGRQEWQRARDVTGARHIYGPEPQGDNEALRRDGPVLKPGEILIPTGGTSGRMKFARHSWETLSASAHGFGLFFGNGAVNSLCVLPLYHVSGLMQVIRAIVSGGEVRFLDWQKLRAGEVPASAEGGFLSLVPTQLQQLLAVTEPGGWLRDLTAIPLGGAAASPALLEEAAEQNLPLALSYGATETAAMAVGQKPAEFLSGGRTSGRALPHVSLRISNQEGEELSAESVGRICISGTSLFHGYLPGGSRDKEEEWITGDLGWLDEAGCLTVTGREDRVVVTGGEKVNPEEVERVLAASGLVEDVYVFGVEDVKWGRAVAAAYVSREGIAEARLDAVVRSELAAFKRPKHWIRVPGIPRTGNGKIDGRALERLVGGL